MKRDTKKPNKNKAIVPPAVKLGLCRTPDYRCCLMQRYHSQVSKKPHIKGSFGFNHLHSCTLYLMRLREVHKKRLGVDRLFVDRMDESKPFAPGNIRFVTEKQKRKNIVKRNPQIAEGLACVGGRTGKGVPVIQLHRRTGAFIKRWDTQVAAADGVKGCRQDSINKCIAGRNKTACGFRWVRAEDYEKA